MNENKSCLVIGAGIVGSSCAWHLQKAGFNVSLVDDQAPGQVTSFGNAGCISPSSVLPFSYPGIIREVPGWLLNPDGALKIRWRDLPWLTEWFWRFWRAGNMKTVEYIATAMTPLMKKVPAAFDETLQATGSTGLMEKRGCLMIYDSAEKWHGSAWQYELLKSYGFSNRELNAGEIAELEPDVKSPYRQGRLLEDWQHLLDPGEVSKRIADTFISNGGALIEDRVQQVSANDAGVQLQTVSGQQLQADLLVCAAGVWSNKLAKQLDKSVPMMPKRGYHSMLPEPGVKLSRPVYFSARQFIATPMQHGLRLAGTAEFARVDVPPNYKRARSLVKVARKYLPELNAGGVTEWMGQRPMMPDSIPIISRSPNHPERVIYAFGHGHYGLTQGPLTGALVASLAAGKEPGVDLQPFRFDRF
jgi:D-amino-acid dehydrogenase